MELFRPFLFCLLIATLGVACSRPVAKFVLEGERTAPARLELKNISENASRSTWLLDGHEISEDFESYFILEESGRYELELLVQDGTKSDSYKEEIIIDAPSSCIVLIRTTMGDMAFALSELTPMHQKNFLEVVESGFYKDVLFHRVIDGFMIQAGEKEGDSASESTEIDNEINSGLVHIKGALAAARMPDKINPEKNSSATQFYIVHGRPVDEESLLNYSSSSLIDYTDEQRTSYIEKGGAPQLDMEYTVFGMMIFGEEVLDAIASVKTDPSDRPLEEVRILEIKTIN